MVQILPQQNLGDVLGAGLGSGIGAGAQMALQQYMDLAAKQRQYDLLSKALGFGPATTPAKDVTPEMGQASAQQQQQDRISQIATNPEAMMRLESVNPQAANMIQKMHESNIAQQKTARSEAMAEKKLAFMETKDVRKQIDKSYDSYKFTSQVLDKMEDLNKPGKLAGPWKAYFSQVTGVPISVLSNPESEEFQKLSQNLMRGVTQYGNRILQVEFDNFMKQIPTLVNSEEGRDRIIKNMKIMLEPAKLEYEAKKQILKENNGVPPLDLYDQIQQKVGDKFQKSAQKFETGSIEEGKGKSLTADKAREFLDMANGDKEKARKIAKKYGFSF